MTAPWATSSVPLLQPAVPQSTPLYHVAEILEFLQGALEGLPNALSDAVSALGSQSNSTGLGV